MARFRIVLAVLVIGGLLLSATPALAAPPAAAAAFPGCTQFYRVQHGDNLYRIALRFDVSVYQLMVLNGIRNPNVLFAGQTLCVKIKPIPLGFFYRVKQGDTLFSIAQRNGVSVWLLATVNRLPNPNVIYVGMLLFIPSHEAIAAFESLDVH